MGTFFIEDGYRPSTKVQNSLEIETFRNPSAEDTIHFFKSEGCHIPELQQAIQATVLVSETPDFPGGSGVILSYEAKKYIVTATHVVGELFAGEYAKRHDLKYFYRDNSGEVREGILNKSNLLYDSTTATEKGLPVTDAAIFTFEGDDPGVEVSVEQVATDHSQVAVAIGFPGKFHDSWKESKRPLLSIGKVFKEKLKEMTPAMKEIMLQHLGEALKPQPDLKIYFTGRIIPGNSGGPLVDTRGKVIGVASGPRGTLGKENGIERFSDFRSILEKVSQVRV